MNDKSSSESLVLLFLSSCRSQPRINAAARARSPLVSTFPSRGGTDRCARCWLSSPLCLPSSSAGRRWSITRWTPTLWGSLCSISSLKRSRTCALMCKWEHLLPSPSAAALALSSSPRSQGVIWPYDSLSRAHMLYKPPVKTQGKIETIQKRKTHLNFFLFFTLFDFFWIFLINSCVAA